MYSFDTHYGVSTLTDEETGIVLQWQNGNFNETHRTLQDGATLMTIVPESESPELFIARNLREMAEYVAQNYPELV